MASNSNYLIGKTLGTCRIEKLIGQGGMGVVYLARQIRPARYVAVKVLLPNLTADSQIYKEFLARFQREADVIARLEHVNIMPIYEYGEQDNITYLVMPYLPGGSLRDTLAQQPVPSLRDTVNYISQAASALDYAHAQHVIHRDLKPANFLLHNDGRLVLADFGIARIMQESNTPVVSTLTSTGMMLGTPEYMAPEMFTGNLVDYRSDIYALGIILYQLLSGQVPFKGNTFYSIATRHLQDPPPSIHAAHPAIPAEIDEIIQTALAKKPENRFKSAGALAQALRNTFSLTPETDMLSLPTIITASPPAPAIETLRVVNPTTDPTKLMPEPQREGFTPVSVAQPVTPPIRPHVETKSRQQPLLLFVGILLVIALIVGGVLIGLQINKNNAGTTGTLTGTTTTVSPATHSTTAPAVTTTPSRATATPTTQPTPSPTVPPAAPIPKGRLLYQVAAPGAVSNTSGPCDTGSEHWADYSANSAPIIQCQGTSTLITNPNNDPPDLDGTFLTSLPGGQIPPSNYVIEVKLQQTASPGADFGVYFRNQPGNLNGVYTFLIHPDGTWSTYIYYNAGGQSPLKSGSFGDAHAPVTIDIVANGSNFTFYANGNEIGNVQDITYPTGTAGIAVDAGGTVIASNFALYTIA